MSEMQLQHVHAGTAAETPLGGIVAAAVTPVTDDLRIDVDRLAAHARWLLEQGCRFVSVFGTTGEGPSFSTSEKVAAMRGLIERGVVAHALIPAILTPAIDDAIVFAKAVAAMQCRAALVMPPFFFRGNPGDGCLAFLSTVIDAVQPLDVVLYNYPAMSGVPLTPEIVDKLIARHGRRIAGLKESGGDLAVTLGWLERLPSLAVFTGSDPHLAALVQAGGAGLIGGMPNINPAGLRAIFDACQPDEARAVRLIDAVNASGGIAAIKTLLALLRQDSAWERVMPPLDRVDSGERTRLLATFEREMAPGTAPMISLPTGNL